MHDARLTLEVLPQYPGGPGARTRACSGPRHLEANGLHVPVFHHEVAELLESEVFGPLLKQVRGLSSDLHGGKMKHTLSTTNLSAVRWFWAACSSSRAVPGPSGSAVNNL